MIGMVEIIVFGAVAGVAVAGTVAALVIVVLELRSARQELRRYAQKAHTETLAGLIAKQINDPRVSAAAVQRLLTPDMLTRQREKDATNAANAAIAPPPEGVTIEGKF